MVVLNDSASPRIFFFPARDDSLLLLLRGVVAVRADGVRGVVVVRADGVRGVAVSTGSVWVAADCTIAVCVLIPRSNLFRVGSSYSGLNFLFEWLSLGVLPNGLTLPIQPKIPHRSLDGVSVPTDGAVEGGAATDGAVEGGAAATDGAVEGGAAATDWAVEGGAAATKSSGRGISS